MNCYNPFSLQDKTILVTGASSGIGKATAIECSKMGAKLIITGRNEERLNQTLNALQGTGHLAIIANLDLSEDIKTLINTVDKIDGAVLCAGIGETRPIKFSTIDKFQKIFNTNLFSQTELIRFVCKNKKLNSGASIVAISSISSRTHEFGNGMYGASKAALSTWIKYAANEYGSLGYRFNAICPGMVETPMIRGGAFTNEQLLENMKEYPLKRFGKPEDIAYGAIYLLSNASSWITGTELIIDGGNTL